MHALCWRNDQQLGGARAKAIRQQLRTTARKGRWLRDAGKCERLANKALLECPSPFRDCRPCENFLEAFVGKPHPGRVILV
jgi:hypothetical protein